MEKLIGRLVLVWIIAMSPSAVSAANAHWQVDPTLPNHIVAQSVSADQKRLDFIVRDPVTGALDSITYDKASAQYLVTSSDGSVFGGIQALDPYDNPPSTQCVGPALPICVGGAIALLCEIPRNLAVSRAQASCGAAGFGTEITSQRGCGAVSTRCIRFENAVP